jgi:macrolide-specific efflux system membrane fusion protein
VAALDVVRAQKRSTEATLRQATLAFARQKELSGQDAGSHADLEVADAALNVARATLEALDAQIKQAAIAADTARVNLGYTRVNSPIDGVVVAIVTEQGQTVTSSQAIPTIVKVAQLDTVSVKAQISEGDITRVRPGLPVHFTILGEPDRRFNATLQAVAPAPASLVSDGAMSTSSGSTNAAAAVYYSGRFDVPNPDGRLRISMSAQVVIVIAKAQDAILVPAAALSDIPDAQGLYSVQVEEGGSAASRRLIPRKVKIGLNNRVQAQVLQGLQPGDKVVVGTAGEPTKRGRQGAF